MLDRVLMRAPLLLALVACGASLLPAPAVLAQPQRQSERPFPHAKRQQIDAVVNKAFAAADVPGVVVGIWIPGEGSYVASKGFADLRSRQPMRSTYFFRIG